MKGVVHQVAEAFDNTYVVSLYSEKENNCSIVHLNEESIFSIFPCEIAILDFKICE